MSQQLTKIDFKTLMIVGLIIVILLMQMCNGDKKEINKGDTIKVKGKKYEVVDHRRDTTYLTRDSIVYKKGKDIKVEVKVPVYIPANVDTQGILKDYFARRFYVDTLDLGEKSFVIVKDTITENKILSRAHPRKVLETVRGQIKNLWRLFGFCRCCNTCSFFRNLYVSGLS